MRFTYEYVDDKFYDKGFFLDNGKRMFKDEVLNTLNKLHEENKRVKEHNNKLMKQPLLFGVQTIPNTFEIMEANTQLEEENEQLKQENKFAKLLANHRGEMVAFANSLIEDIDDELTQKMWYQFKEEMYQKWKKKRGIE